MGNIKNIIFDLGNVLLDIDPRLSEKAFAELGVKDFKSFFSLEKGNMHLFNQLETGLEEQIFYDGFRRETGLTLSNEAIRDAWNALLIGFRKKSIDSFPRLRQKYRLFLLSNTNEIHLQAFHQMFSNNFQENSFDALFEEAFYSHRIGLRKPNAGAFEFVLNKQQLHAAETLFIDDLADNIQTATQLGMQTVHLTNGMFIENLDL
jgi:putative hydrolase of the HAD superfamily